MAGLPGSRDIFEDVKKLKNVILRRVKDHLNISDLFEYLNDDFTEASIQEIQAQIKQHGTPYTTSQFFQLIGRNPSSFITFMAALKLTKQTDVYSMCLDQIRKTITKPGRADYLIGLIAAKVKTLDPHHNDDQDDGDTGGSGGGDGGRGDGGGGGGSGGSRGGGAGGDKRGFDADGGIGRSGDGDWGACSGGYNRGGRQGVPIQDPVIQRSTSGTCVSSMPQQVLQPGQGGDNLRETRPQSDPGTIIYQRNQGEAPKRLTSADNSIEDLKANVYEEIAEELQKRTTEAPHKPLWKLLANSQVLSLQISRKDTKIIEISEMPGQEFLDLLGERGYTISQLEDMFSTLGLERPLQVLQQHSNEVVLPSLTSRAARSSASLETSYEENDLNQPRSLPPDNRLENVSTSTPASVINSTTSSGNIPNLVPSTWDSIPANAGQAANQCSVIRQADSDPAGELSEQNADMDLSEFRRDHLASQQTKRDGQVIRENSGTGNSQYQRLTKSTEVSNEPGEAGARGLDEAAAEGGDDSIDTAMKEIQDVPMKGTRPIPAVGDPDGVRSTPNSERACEKLRDARVSQHDGDPSNLHSFNDVQKGGNENQSASSVQQTQDNMPSHEFGSNLDDPAFTSDVQNVARLARGEESTETGHRLTGREVESELQTGSMSTVSVHHATTGDNGAATQPEYSQSIDEESENNLEEPSAQFENMNIERNEENMPASEVFRNVEHSDT